ncbi:hypothetical protein BDF14DRAFT_1770697 [Spinellus fusiger]|nr:hypothetical protein BDF14DRAFT_1770697 [Spinellus fusiger]
MVVITREQEICMFYCEEYNETNVENLTKEVDAIKNVDICYSDDPDLLEVDVENTNEALKIHNAIELVQFLNIVYIPFDPNNNEVYENKCLTLNDILVVLKYSDLFEDKSAIGFGKWCSNKKVNFMKSAIKRRVRILSKTGPFPICSERKILQQYYQRHY